MRIVLAFLLCFIGTIAHATTYYLDAANGSDSNTGKSVSAAWQTHYHAFGVVVAGDNVCMMNTAAYGHFSIIGQTSTAHLGSTTDSGTASFGGTKPITWYGCDGSGNRITFGTDGLTASATRPVINIESGATTTLALQIKSNNSISGGLHPIYMVFDGIQFTASQNLTTCDNNNKSAIGIETSSHVAFIHDDIWCSGGNGVDADAAQFIQIDHSLIHENAHAVESSPGKCVYGSGISYLRSYDWHGVTGMASDTSATDGTKTSSMITMQVSNSRIWNNYNDEGTVSAGHTCGPTDGNGVILDRNDGSCEVDLGPCDSAFKTAGITRDTNNQIPPYTGWIDLSGNLVYSNGGGGLHVYLSVGKVTMRNNSTYYNNNRSTNVGNNEGELDFLQFGNPDAGGYTAVSGAQIIVEHNTMWNKGVVIGKRQYPQCFSNTKQASAAAAVYKNNVCYDASGGGHTTHFSGNNADPTITNQVLSDPLYNSVSAGSDTADFRLKSTTPADGFTASSSSEFITPDIVGDTSRSTSAVTAGAYQVVLGGTTGGCTSTNHCTVGSGVGPFVTNCYVVSYGPVALDTGTSCDSNNSCATYASGNVADVCVPVTSGTATWTGPYPVLLIAHGGGWSRDSRVYDISEANTWASIGMVAINIDYRLETNTTQSGGYPGINQTNVWPAPFVDTQLAIRWLCDNATVYKADCSHMIGKGDSAGGTLVMQAAMYPGIYPNGTDAAVSLHTTQTAAPTAIVDEFGPALVSTPNNSTNTPIVFDLMRKYGLGIDAFMGVNGLLDVSVPRASTDAVFNSCKQQSIRICRRVIYTSNNGDVKTNEHEFAPSGHVSPSENTIRTWELQFGADYLHSVGYPNVFRPADSSS